MHLLVTILIALVVAGPVAAQSAGERFTVEGRTVNVDTFNRQVAEILADASLPALSLAVMDQGEVVFYHTYGYKQYKRKRNGQLKGKGKVNGQTLFEACSLSKSFFVLAVHRLVDRQVLNLDTPLYQYLPYPRLEHDPRYQQITGRMVLSHASGIENWQEDNDGKVLEIMRDPGTEYVYSGEGYVYLSKVVEKLLGQPVEQYMEALVYEPLDLRRTYTVYSKNGRRPGNFSTGHDAFLKAYPKSKPAEPNIAGGINTTAYDYARLLIGIFSGKHLSQSRISDLIGRGTAAEAHYGPGFNVFYNMGDTLLFQHGNNTQFKGFGGYNFTRHSGVVMFVNGERGDQVRSSITKLLFEAAEPEDPLQYPNPVFTVIKEYNARGYAAALVKLKAMLAEESKVSGVDLQELETLFKQKEPEFAAYIAQVLGQRFKTTAGQ